MKIVDAEELQEATVSHIEREFDGDAEQYQMALWEALKLLKPPQLGEFWNAVRSNWRDE